MLTGELTVSRAEVRVQRQACCALADMHSCFVILIACRDRLRADPAEHALLLAETNLFPKAAREKCVELLFEHFKVPALFLAKNAVSRISLCADVTATSCMCNCH